MAWSTSANRSEFVAAALVYSSLPVLSKRFMAAVRGSSERTSCAYGSMEASKDINPELFPIQTLRTLIQLAFLPCAARFQPHGALLRNQGRGSTGRPPLRISKYRAGLDRPPESPTVAMVSPAVTRSPTSLYSRSLWP
jgi:hypothetical protein